MKRLGLTFLMAVFMGASLMLLNEALAEADTCSSVCNQIRQACLAASFPALLSRYSCPGL